MTDETVEEPTLDAGPAADERDPHTPADAADAEAGAEESSAPDAVVDEPAASGRRGSLAIHGVAFALLVVAAACLVVGALGILSIVDVAETSVFGTQRILRISAVIAALSIVAAIVAVLVPRRCR